MSSGGGGPRPSGRDYLRLLLPALPGARLLPPLRRGGTALPDEVVALDDVRVDRVHQARYARLCGFPVSDGLPATYPHLLGFGAQLHLMADRRFPFAATGLVHVANSITQHRALDASQRLSLRVHAEGLRPHPRGRQLDLVTTVSVGGQVVWTGTSTYLRRSGGQAPSGQAPIGQAAGGPPAGRTSADQAAASPAGATWRLPADLGRRYAAVSGDRNPIHLSPWTARLFGFPRAIAHGMWTAARALAEVQHRLPAAYRYDVSFGAPVLLPSVVTVTARGGEEPNQLRLRVLGRSGRPHLTGTVEPL